jgi:hypothetical protein
MSAGAPSADTTRAHRVTARRAFLVAIWPRQIPDRFNVISPVTLSIPM